MFRSLKLMQLGITLLLSAVYLSATAAPDQDSFQDAYQQQADSADSLKTLLTQRLQLMRDVAAYKWLNGRPVEDLAREQVVLDAAVSAGLTTGMTVDSSQAFFSAQIHAAKDIQYCWFEQWKTDPGTQPDQAPDLNQQLRPELIRLGNAITAAITVTAQQPNGLIELRGDTGITCLSADAWQQLVQAAKGISFYDDRLAQILGSGTLRVGTTGDYAPFSSDAGGSFQGIDIDLAQDLARALDVSVEFVPTTWPRIMQDLGTGHFDIAMSGVSRTVNRARSAYFSDPYHVGGKTPITLCGQVDQFDSMEKIDQPGVRVIVNPGGTNEKFLDRTIKRASKVLHDDNRTIFDAIVEGKADLMMTDAIEVRLKTAQIEALCAAMPGQTLTYQEKGFLMPQDEPLRHAVNLWLNQRIGDGTLEQVFAAHLTR